MRPRRENCPGPCSNLARRAGMLGLRELRNEGAGHSRNRQDVFGNPTGRFRWEGEFSADAFLEDVLMPVLRRHEHVHLDFRDCDPGSDFLEGVFGGLVRRGFEQDYLRSHLHILPGSGDHDGHLAQFLIDNAASHPNAPSASEIRVYVDANIIQHSDVDRTYWLPEDRTLDWGGFAVETRTYPRYEVIDKRSSMTNDKLRRELVALQLLAQFDRLADVRFFQQFETGLEANYRPGVSPPLFGASIVWAASPIPYARAVLGFGARPQLEFIQSIDHPRFRYFQKLSGVQPGMSEQRRRAQMLDAWHLWCAERNECGFFLTMDFKLIKMLSGIDRTTSHDQPRTPLRVIEPSRLLVEAARRLPLWRTARVLAKGLWDIRRTVGRRRVYDIARDGHPPPPR